MNLEIWLAFCAASVALVLIPGPSVLMTMSYALSHGRKVALATVAGVALGSFLAMTASLAGLGALVLASSTLFTILKWVGAAYLVYMGVKLFRTAGTVKLATTSQKTPVSAGGVFLNATMVTTLNPKSIIFFIAFVPQFVETSLPLFPQFAILIVTFVTIAALDVLMYALLADKLRQQITKPSVMAWMSRISGSALIAMGVGTAVFKRGGE